MDNLNLQKLLKKNFTFWESISENEQKAILSSAVSMHFTRGQNIHDGGECTGIIMPATGSIRIYILSDEGKEITLYRLFPGDMCILSASCVLNTIDFDVYVDAEEDSECVIIGGCVFEEISRSNPEVKIFALEAALSRFSDVMWVMQQILFMSMDKRLAIFLLDECNKTGSDTVRLTHEQIAKYIGSAREVVSRMIKYFSTEGIIESSRSGGIKILNKAKLRSLTV